MGSLEIQKMKHKVWLVPLLVSITQKIFMSTATTWTWPTDSPPPKTEKTDLNQFTFLQMKTLTKATPTVSSPTKTTDTQCGNQPKSKTRLLPLKSKSRNNTSDKT